VQEYYKTECEAIAAAAAVDGAVVTRDDYTASDLPEQFWALLRTENNPLALRIRTYAETNYNGCVGSAWADALDGEVRGIKISLVEEIDRQWRLETNHTRWMVATPHVDFVRTETESWPSEGWTTED
jgi:hypothetical protein